MAEVFRFVGSETGNVYGQAGIDADCDEDIAVGLNGLYDLIHSDYSSPVDPTDKLVLEALSSDDTQDEPIWLR